MAIVASGAVTLTDINDAKQLAMYIGASQTKTVIYDGISTYVPNYATVATNQILTPQLFVAGTTTNVASQAKSTKWFYQLNGTGALTEITANTTDYTLGTTMPKTLTIKSNVLASRNSVTYICELVYTDTGTGFDTINKSEIEVVKVTSGRTGSDGASGADGRNGIDGEDGVDGTNGKDGENAVFVNVWTPDGNTVKNGEGTVSCKADIYSGTSQVSGSTFKWYVQDTTATVSSGGDADGGAGWRLLTASYNLGITGFTTATVIVPANAVTGMESLKCVATYNNVKYMGVTTVVDLSDPIFVRIDGLDRFKNGEGTITARATLLQGGDEVDVAGTGGYIYQWSIYDGNNVKTAFNKTGKQITVNATDIDNRGNLICDVSK